MFKVVKEARRTLRRIDRRPAELLEALESRQLLSHVVADYLPLSAGDQWHYAGTLNGAPVTATVNASNGGSIGGFAATRINTILTPTDGSAGTSDTRYYAHTSTGLRLLRQDFHEPSLNTNTLFGVGVRFLTPSVDDGASVHFAKSFTGSSSDGRAWSGQFIGDMVVVGLENITAGSGSFEALRVSYNGTFTETGTTGWTASGTVSETRWLVLGVGAAHIDYSMAITYSDQDPHAVRYNLGLVDATRLRGVTSTVVRGKGVDVAYGDSSPGAADGTNFAGIDVNGGLKTRVFTITNTSATALTLAPGSQGFITIGGANASDFVVVRQPAQSILPGQTTFFSVRFDPSATGFRYANVSFATNVAGAAPFKFDIRGTGILLGVAQVMGPQSQIIPDGAASPTAALGTAFGSTAAAGIHRIQRTFTIVNSGPGNLVLTSANRVVISGPDAQDFTVTLLPSVTLAPGQSTMFKISFDPSAAGGRHALVSIATNDRLNPVFTFAIGGTGA